MSRAQGAAGADVGPDGSVSRPSKNNRQDRAGAPEPSELPGPSRRPVAVKAGTTLRDEARAVKVGPGEVVPLSKIGADGLDPDDEIQARPMYRVVEEWRRWMRSYENSHIEYESDEGETVRAPLENSYQTAYAKRYYARLKDLERAVEREYESLTTVMLTFTASHRNAEGNWRCPADHLSDVREGWDTARKQLYQMPELRGVNWEYARILEPHKDGYGHLHVAVFVETDDLDAEAFRPVMRSHVNRVESAGSEAHGLETPGLGETVSVGGDGEIESLAGYLSEYLGAFAEGTALERPMNEQVFLATTWATNSRRLDFSNGAQELIADEKFRRETGLRPEDRGGAEACESGGEGEDGTTWEVRSLCEVEGREPRYYDPTTGGVEGGPIDGREGVDPPKSVP